MYFVQGRPLSLYSYRRYDGQVVVLVYTLLCSTPKTRISREVRKKGDRTAGEVELRLRFQLPEVE